MRVTIRINRPKLVDTTIQLLWGLYVLAVVTTLPPFIIKTRVHPGNRTMAAPSMVDRTAMVGPIELPGEEHINVTKGPVVSFHDPGVRLSSGCAQLNGVDLDSMISITANRHKVDAAIVRAIVRHESAGSPCAVSKSGARGLMQLMPGTARELGVTNLGDSRQNLDAGVRYFKFLLDRFNNDLKLALAAYNAGPKNVLKYSGIPPFRETQQYVAKILNQLNDSGE